MTSDLEKIRIQQAHLDGAEIEWEWTAVPTNQGWRMDDNPAWNWVDKRYRTKEKQYYFADGSLVTEEAKKGKFVVAKDTNRVYTLSPEIADTEVYDATFIEHGHSWGRYFYWSDLLPLKEPEQYRLADNTLVTEELKKNRFLIRECVFGVGKIVTHLEDRTHGECLFKHDDGTTYRYYWSDMDGVYKEPEYIPFTQEIFPFEPVWISRKDSGRSLIISVGRDGISINSTGGVKNIGWNELLEKYEIVNPDGTRSVCGLEVVK